MPPAKEQEETEVVKAPRKPTKVRVLTSLDGAPIYYAAKRKKGDATPKIEYRLDKFDRDVLIYWHGEEARTQQVKGKPRTEYLTSFDPYFGLGDKPLQPSIHSPVCQKCQLHLHDCRHPFMDYAGPDDPLITILFDSVARGEDINGELGTDGSALSLRKIIKELQSETGVAPEDVRWVPMTRCANWHNKPVNFKSRGSWCRYHVIDDILRHPPTLLMPVGTAALGLLSHKSNAQEWSGRLLTYRGWPDDMLTDPDYALARPDPLDPTKTVVGHPVFGPVPDWSIPMVPIQAPRLIYALRNPAVFNRWKNGIVKALKMAKQGVRALNYQRPWYQFTENVTVIESTLTQLLRHPGILLAFDTETTGLKQWATTWANYYTENVGLQCRKADARVVSMMFRWVDPEDGKPRSLGFPWEAERCLIKAAERERLKPLIWKLLTQSKIIGHNITFDMLFAWTSLNSEVLASGWGDSAQNRRRDELMCSLANACAFDTWHMAFAWQQKRGSLGLEALSYDWVPDLAGYEEDFTLLIDLHYEDMHPEAAKGGHYLNCPRDKFDTHLKPYVMGDVEVAYRAYEKILDKLDGANVYEIPIADPQRSGHFRWFTPPDRHWLYHKIMSPASRVLMKMMARGLYIDANALQQMSEIMPTKIMALREELRTADPKILAWCVDKAKQEPGWELDLENKGQLKELLFDLLEAPVLRLTKAGKKIYGENIEEAKGLIWAGVERLNPKMTDDELDKEARRIEEHYAAVDKFTLNKLTVKFEKLRPLRKYRKAYKLYTTYVRPLQNIMTANLDKKKRKADPHLCFDQCIHASFLLTGTRSGRLSARDPNLQNLPRDGEVKSMFTSRFGVRGCIYQGDLSQIELRLIAALSGDSTMIKAYHDGIDLHSLTASRIFDTPYEQYTKDYMKFLQTNGKTDEAKQLELNRVVAKTTNFLTGYGGGAFGLQNVLANNDIDKPLEECEDIIESFFESYPSIRSLLQYYKKFIMDFHVAVSIFGRVRVLEEVRSDDREAISHALRAGCNHLIQSTASDMMLTALFAIEQLMRDADLESILVSTVHDSLVIDAIRDELPQIHQIVTDVLNNFPTVFKLLFGEAFDTSWMTVPFSGDCEVGNDYLHVKKITGDNPDWQKLLLS